MTGEIEMHDSVHLTAEGSVIQTRTLAEGLVNLLYEEQAAEITRLRAELERVREAGRKLLLYYDDPDGVFVDAEVIAALRSALEGEAGK